MKYFRRESVNRHNERPHHRRETKGSEVVFVSKYDEDEGPDYALDEEDRINEILKDLEIIDYDNVEKIINEPGMHDTHKDKIISY